MSVSTGPQPNTRRGAAAALWRRVVPQGGSWMNWASYAVIFVVLVTLILDRDALPSTARFYGTLLAVIGMLILNIFWEDLISRFPTREPADWIVIGAGAALTLLATWLGGHIATLYLLFMIAAQVFATKPFTQALLAMLVLLAAYVLLLVQLGATLETLINLALGAGMGMVFVIVLAVLLRRNNEQTELAQRLAADLQAANAELIAARQREKELAVAEERVRLAREIHDGLGHHLTVLNIQLQAAGKLLERDPDKAAGIIAICRDEAQAALDEVRHSVAVMRRSPLDGRSLEDALRALVAEFDEHATLDACFVMDGIPRKTGPATAMTLYRAAQEGLTNAQKHAAAARSVTVRLEFGAEAVLLSVEDDGGAHPDGGEGADQEVVSGGFGLAGLRERAEQLGGLLLAAPGAGGGFRLALTIPLDKERT